MTEPEELLNKHGNAGFKLLARRFGESWVDDIDPATLNMSLSANCVLGKTFGTYTNGLRALWPIEEAAEKKNGDTAVYQLAYEHGFCTMSDGRTALWHKEPYKYPALTTWWVNRLTEARATRPAA